MARHRIAPMTAWRARLAAKLVLARLPVSYATWRRIGIFRHGAMTSPEYAIAVFEQHTRLARDELDLTGLRMLELGPGDSLFSALLANARGSGKITFVDSGRYADDDVRRYQVMADVMAQRKLGTIDLDDARTLNDVLQRCNATYLTQGLHSLRAIPDASVDFTWSHATLEHISKSEFAATVCELRRVTAPDGLASHRIDLRDHLGDALNNLRFSRRVWESRLMTTSGFYTNRLRYSELLGIFRRAGFECAVTQVDRWPELPTPRPRLSREYRLLPDDELRIRGFDVVLRPRARVDANAG